VADGAGRANARHCCSPLGFDSRTDADHRRDDLVTLSSLKAGDVFRLADGTRACFILKAHRDGNDIRRPYVDAIELDAWGQQRRWRCFAPDRTVRVVRRAA
jgi:hypothetical protein